MPHEATFESFERELNRLVEAFGRRLAELKQPGYAEAQLRDDFLNPLFRALGWDMENRAGLIQSEREVEIESATQIGGRRKRADYLFRADKLERFVCEVKKPAEELHARAAFQAKRYAWNKGVPVALLTDFEEVKLFIVGVRDLTAWQEGGGFRKAVLPASKLAMPEWTFSASPHAAVLERVCANNARLADVADRIFQGLVTGADPVFILEKRGKGFFYSEVLGREVQLEPDLLHPLCKGSVNVRRYEIDHITKSLLFPYRIAGTKAALIPVGEFAKKYPKCWRYLGENRDALEGRERGKWHHDKWYAFGRSQNLAEMEQEKILTPSIAKRASFTHDLDNFYFFIGSGGGGGGGYGITLKPETKESYRYLLALLNSKLLDTIVKSVSSPFANGYYAYNRQYIEQLPIRRIDFSDPVDKSRHDGLVQLVDKMLGLMPKLRTATADSVKAVLQNAVTAADQQIDRIVYELYGLTPDEIALVEGA